jgi:hypothetical protein
MKRLLRMLETTTPTQAATGSASVVNTSKLTKVNQPSGGSVRLAYGPHQQDSDEKKSGQSPPPFSSHGSPSSDQTDQRKDEPPWPR